MDQKYRYERHIFDISRRFFLFGRDRAIAELRLASGNTVLEIGCGTGRNLKQMVARTADASFVGIDISSEMLKSARAKISKSRLDSRVRLLHGDATRLPRLPFPSGKASRVLMCYSLSMIPDWRAALVAAIDALEVGGILSIVDFGDFSALGPRVARYCIDCLSRHDAPPCLALGEELQRHAGAGAIAFRHFQGPANFYQIAVVQKARHAG